MEFVSQDLRARRAQRASDLQAGAAIAEMHPAVGERRFQRQQARHRMALSGRILHPRAQHHVAPTLTMNGNGALGQRAQPVVKTMRRRQCSRVQLGIAAGQPYRIGSGIGRLVGQRRERQDLRAGRPPAIEQMRIDEGESAILGERDTLAGRIEANRSTVSEPGGLRAAADGVEIDRGFDHAGERIESLVDIGRLAGLDEPEMPLRQGEMLVLDDRAEQRNADAREGRRDQRGVARARHAIQDHAGDRNVVAIARATDGDGRRGLGLAGNVQHQHDRPAEQGRQVGRRAARGLTGFGHAIEQAHDALDEGDIG